MEYPNTRRVEFREEIFGHKIDDPYRWMEDDRDSAVIDWVEKQNLLTDAWLKDSDVVTISQQLQRDMDVFSQGLPWRRGGYYFWYERQPGQRHRILYWSKSAGGADKQVVIDPNRLSDDGSVALSFFAASQNASYAVYGIQDGGSERDRVFIRNLHTGEEEEFYFGRTFRFNWATDESGFYYVRSNFEEHGGRVEDETHYQQAYFHKLGKPRSEDLLLFDAVAEGYGKDVGLSIHATDDDTFVALNMAQGWSKRKIFISEFNKPFTEVVPEIDEMKSLRLIDEWAYVTTNHQANNNRVLRTKIQDVTKPAAGWQEFIAEQADRKLEGWYVTKNTVLVEYVRTISTELDVLDRQGKYIRSMELPALSSIIGLWASKYFDEFYFAVVSFLSPAIHYHGIEHQKPEEIWRDPRAFSGAFEARQVWYSSKDGTKIPMSIVADKGMAADGQNRVILNGYGGFGHGKYPNFMGAYKPWLEAGGVVAIPNIRGGDEFGEDWHKAGMLGQKQNCFDDMIGAAEFLVAENISQPKYIAITGGSNGGLLVGACIMQRPELFGAAVCEVPLLDMIRYPKFLMAHRWTHEYGDPGKADEFEWLIQYSPYHQFDGHKLYPPILFITALNDSRVHPMHAWKMAARMQSKAKDNVVLLRSRGQAGHGPGKAFQRQLVEFAEKLAFIGRVTGMNFSEGDANV